MLMEGCVSLVKNFSRRQDATRRRDRASPLSNGNIALRRTDEFPLLLARSVSHTHAHTRAHYHTIAPNNALVRNPVRWSDRIL